MIVVADTSPFVVLLTIGHLDILPSLFGRIVVPPEVITELNSPNRSEAVRSFTAALPSWLDIQTPTSVEEIEGLHAGEIASIALARELFADRLVIDEARGRMKTQERGIPIIGTIGVLIAAAQRGLLDLEQAFERVKRTDFWVTQKFLEERLAMFRDWEKSNCIG